MKKSEKLLSIKKTLSEVQNQATIVFCSSDGAEIPYNQTVPIQKYTISFCDSFRGLLLDEDIVREALKKNLDNIFDTIKLLAQLALDQAEKDALVEAEENLVFIKKEIQNENTPK